MHCFYHLFGFEQVFQSIRRVEYDVPLFVTGDSMIYAYRFKQLLMNLRWLDTTMMTQDDKMHKLRIIHYTLSNHGSMVYEVVVAKKCTFSRI